LFVIVIISVFRFMADKRRMNVALTRAKYALYIVCNLESFEVTFIFSYAILSFSFCHCPFFISVFRVCPQGVDRGGG